MTAQEFLTISAAIKAAYPNATIMPDKASMDVWYTMLSDLDYKVCMVAIKEIISTQKFAPTISEIREKCAQNITKPLDSWVLAWGNVLRSIQNYVMYREDEALESLDEFTATIVRRMGYQNICLSEEIAVERANFRMAYENQAKYQQQKSVLPLSVQEHKKALIEKYNNLIAEKDD